jgi:MFS family permease
MGQLQSYYATHQLAAYPKATIAWISTLQSTLTFFASVFFGRIFDAHGAKILVRVGTTLSVASLVAVACK